MAEYTTNVIGRRVLENSFGTGNILKSIVKRYIEICMSENIPASEISQNLGNDIYGIELDTELFESCKNDLNSIIEDYELPAVIWKLYNENALTWVSDLKFDLVIGTPIYYL